MTSQLLFYRDITPLNREKHRDLKFQAPGDCGFAAGCNTVPIAGPEFFAAAHHYPIAFVGDDDNPVPVVLLGLSLGHNDFIGADKRWYGHAYLPAYVRRYPFVLSSESDERFTVCFDSSYSGWNNKKGEALFGKEGQNSAFLDESIVFLQELSRALVLTRDFTDKLRALNLFVSRDLHLKHPSGADFILTNFRVVDEKKFRHLPAKQIRELHQSGHLAWIDAHLMSLSRLGDLFDMYLRRQAADTARQHAAVDVED